MALRTQQSSPVVDVEFERLQRRILDVFPALNYMVAETIQELNTGANACSVEWCPFTNLEDYVACSTYLLDRNTHSPMSEIESSEGLSRTRDQDHCTTGGSSVANAGHQHQTRRGTVGLHKLVYSDSDVENTHGLQFAKVEECGWRSLNGGVLDSKWMEHPLSDSTAVLACATSIGRLVLYGIQLQAEGEDTAQLQMLSTSDDDDVLLLSLDWNGGKAHDSKIVVSRSDGQLAVWRMRPGSSTPVVEGDPWPAHKLRGGVPTEAWISFYRKGARYSDAEFVVSGGDEGMMKGWDLRSCGGSGASPAFVSKHHRAGVTAGQWHPHREHIFASGSYDESVRIWDIRNIRDPILTLSTGGGLWRLKWHPLPEKSDILLAACMHAGVVILDTDTAKASNQETGDMGDMGEALLTRYTRHESMAYGADWCRVPQVLGSSHGVVASCSFYDNLYCLWQTPLFGDGARRR